MRIILGSQSPRRRELMSGLDIPYEAVTIDADEHYPAGLTRGAIPYYISRAKARAYEERLHEDELLITSDTIVWLRDMMLGKPHDMEDARRMLRLLSGQTHQVYTAVTFSTLKEGALQMETLVEQTDVTFRTLSDEEIDYYLAHYRPLDKAGAYGVQEWIGFVGVDHMVGSYFNVMGFPIDKVYLKLKEYINVLS